MVSFLILAFPVKHKPIFERLNQATAPLTKKFYGQLSIEIVSWLDRGVDFGRSLFSNAQPSLDNINVLVSAPLRKREQSRRPKTRKSPPKRKNPSGSDDYSFKDKQRLMELLDQ